MQEIQDTILTYLLETKGDKYVDDTISRYQKLYQAAEGTKSYRDAANEMVNDTLIGLFTTDKGAKDFVSWCNSNNKKSTLEKIADFIQAIVDALRSLISDTQISSQARSVAEMSEEKAQEVRDRIFAAMDKAIENYQEVTEGNEEVGNRNSLDANSGYSGWSMSKRALEAYESGEMPISKWTKGVIIDNIREYYGDDAPFSIDKLAKVPLRSLKNRVLRYSSWHHTGKNFNRTDFYEIDYDYLDDLTDADIDNIKDPTPAEAKKRAERYKKRTDELTPQNAKDFIANNKIEYSSSGNGYIRGRKPTSWDYDRGLENFFKKGENRVRTAVVEDNESYYWIKIPQEFDGKEWVDVPDDNVAYALDVADNEDIRYSLETDANGKKFVNIQEDILEGITDDKQIKEYVKAYMKEYFPTLDMLGFELPVNAKSRNEFTNSTYTKMLQRDLRGFFLDKMRIAGSLEEIVSAADGYKWQEIKKSRKDNALGFVRGKVQVRIGNNDYIADVVLENLPSRGLIFYDLVGMNPTIIEVANRQRMENKSQTADAMATPNLSISSSKENASTNSRGGDIRYTQDIRSSLSADAWEGKQRYVDRLMSENAKVDTLSKEEHEVLRELARYRHELHTSWDEIFNSEATDILGDFLDFAEENNLPIDFNYEELVTDLDYYEILSDEEREEYEEQAEEYNRENPDSAFSVSGLQMWKEDGNYEEFADQMENLNKQIEDYLISVDEEHGTHYAPTGIARSRYSLELDSEGRELSEAQQEYFKDSKILDDEGNLLVVYHGTTEDFNTFDSTKTRANMDIQGNFFSPWEIDAAGYGENVRAYYLNITNPASSTEGYKALNRFKGQNNAGVKAREYLENLGYDGVNNDNEEFIAFYPEQIKLVENENPTENEDIRYSLETDVNGKKFVNIQEDIIEGITDDKQIKEYVKAYMEEYIPTLDMLGFELPVLTKSRKEFVGSDYTEYIRKNLHDLFIDKMRIANNLEDVISAAEGYTWEQIKHSRKDNALGFVHGKVQIRVGGNDYVADIVLENLPKQGLIFYDIVDMKPTKIKTAGTPSIAKRTSVSNNPAVFNSSIPSSEEKSSTNYSLDIPTTYALDDYDPFVGDDVWATKESKDAFANTIIKAANDVLDFNISDKSIGDIADKVIDEYSSTVDKDFVVSNLRNIFDAMGQRIRTHTVLSDRFTLILRQSS